MSKKKKAEQGWGASTGRKKAPKKKADAKVKAKAETKTEAKPRRGRVTHRVNTIKPNGSMSESVEIVPGPDERVTIGEAMRRAVEELGEVVVDDKLAPSQLRQLAEYYEDVTRAQAAFNEKSEAAKVAKKSLESATNLLLERVRAFTHPAPLPFFDQVQAEDGHQEMLDAIAMAGGAAVDAVADSADSIFAEQANA